ncbi:MAG: glycosyl hydrolase [Halobacteriaceae archaeon]
MKLGGVGSDDEIYVTKGRWVGILKPSDGYRPLSKLPMRGDSVRKLKDGVYHHRYTKLALSRVTGYYTNAHVHPLPNGTLLATLGRDVYRSNDGANTWDHCYTLPSPSGRMGLLPTSVCSYGDRIFLAEYTFGDIPARILVSDDNGTTWETYLETRDHRHFHGVFRDPYEDSLWASAGDANEESAIGRLRNGRFNIVGNGSQLWRTVEMTFTPSRIIWGMDCSYCDPVRILATERDSLSEDTTPTETLTTVGSSVYYFETIEIDKTLWVVAATQSETGHDSTAPPGVENKSERKVRVIAAKDDSNFRNWYELFTFTRTKTVGDFLPGVPSANGYLYLDSHPKYGLIVNPFNMGRHHGSMHLVRPSQFVKISKY